jgi:hypothetical protein
VPSGPDDGNVSVGPDASSSNYDALPDVLDCLLQSQSCRSYCILVLAILLQALSYCDEDFMLQLHGPHLDKAEEITNPVFLNMAAVQLRIRDYAAAAQNATQVDNGSGSQCARHEATAPHSVSPTCKRWHKQLRQGTEQHAAFDTVC